MYSLVINKRMISFIVGKQNNEPLTLLTSTSCQKKIIHLENNQFGQV